MFNVKSNTRWLTDLLIFLSQSFAVRLPQFYLKKKEGVCLLRSSVRGSIIPEDIKMGTCFKDWVQIGKPVYSNTFCTLNPPVSPGVSRSNPSLEWMARWDVSGMPAACGMNKHIASLSSDNGEAEGSCPEPAGNRVVVCQPLCNSHFKEALTSPSGLFWAQPGWAIIIMGSPGSLGIDRGAVYWGELIDSCLITWLSLTGKLSDGKRTASEEDRAKEGPRGHRTCWAWGSVSGLPSVSPTNSGCNFPTCSSGLPLAYRETMLPICLCLWASVMKDTQNSDPFGITLSHPPLSHL